MQKIACLAVVLASISGCAGSSEFKFVTPDKTFIHPVLRNTNWVRTDGSKEYFVDSDGKKLLWWKADYYIHPTESWSWYKGVHEIFGQKVLKAYGVDDKKRNISLHYIAIYREQTKDWFLVESDAIGNEFVKENDRIVGVKLTLYNKDQTEEIESITVKRKK